MASRSESSSRSIDVGIFASRKTASCWANELRARDLERGTNSMRRRSIHVVERNWFRGSEEPTGAGTGAVVNVGRVAMTRGRRCRLLVQINLRFASVNI